MVGHCSRLSRLKKKTEANIIEALASDEIIQKCLELGTSGKTVTTS
jgi:hypothetical protein